MADKIFYIPEKNSSRWLDQGVTYDQRFNGTMPFAYRKDNNNYYEQRQSNDIGYVYVISDYVPTLKYYDCHGALITSPHFVPVATVAGRTYTAYLATVDFGVFPVNQNAIGYITYIDDALQLQTYACTPIDVRSKWSNSKLINYACTLFPNGSDNDAIFWDTLPDGMNIRVDSVLEKYQPKSNRTDFNDQDYNGTLVFGQTWIQQTLLIYNSLGLGLPDWIVLKLNAIFTECDNLKINADNYIAVSEQEFKLSRPDVSRVVNGEILNEDAYATIDVQLVPNPKFGRLNSGDTPDDTPYQIMPAPIEFTNKAAPFVIANTFKGDMVLVFLYVINSSGSDFDMQMGTTLGGTDIEFRIPIKATAEVQVFELHHGFKTPTDLYATIPTGVSISGWIRYDNLKQPNIPVTPATKPNYIKGDWSFYSPANPADIPNEFNLTTGVGIPGSDHEGCVIANTNGYAMFDTGKSPVGMTMVHDPAHIGDLVNQDGAVTIAKANLPAEGILLFNDGDDPTNKPGNKPTASTVVNIGRSTGGSAEYYLSGTSIDPVSATLGKSGNLGTGTPLPINIKGLKGVWFTYVG